MMKPKNGGRTTTLGSRTRRDWEEGTLRPSLDRKPEGRREFSTVSSLPIERLYAPGDLKDWDASEKLGFPGEPPFTRGVHPTM